MTLINFAEMVIHASKRVPNDLRFGRYKVFIDHVWKTCPFDLRMMTNEDFKDMLMACHRERLLTLSRADLVQAMDPLVVKASESRYMNAEFHFVNLEGC